MWWISLESGGLSALNFVPMLDTSGLEVLSGPTCTSVPEVAWGTTPSEGDGSCDGSKPGWFEVGCVLSCSI